MDLLLRPGESIEFRWGHVGKQYTAGEPVPPGQTIRDGQGDLLAGWGPLAYENLVNGRLCYRPDLSGPLARQGAEIIENARFDAASSIIRPETSKGSATVTWRFSAPYVFVGGNAAAAVRLAAGGSAEWRYSADAKTWQPVGSVTGPCSRALAAALDSRLAGRIHPGREDRIGLRDTHQAGSRRGLDEGRESVWAEWDVLLSTRCQVTITVQEKMRRPRMREEGGENPAEEVTVLAWDERVEGLLTDERPEACHGLPILAIEGEDSVRGPWGFPPDADQRAWGCGFPFVPTTDIATIQLASHSSQPLSRM